MRVTRSLSRAPWLVMVAFVAMTAVLSAEPEGHKHHHWGYTGAEGPAHWGELEGDFAACSHGHRQSPIDIRHATPADLPPITFDYKPSELHVVDNGHTIMVNVGAGSSIEVGGHHYSLVQFHFHKPSEEHVDGNTYPMEAHLVHKDDEGHLAVVAVLLTPGQANATIDGVWRHLPKEKEHELDVPGVTIDPAGLLPADHGYYTFEGSLTTPPCTEGVTWLVLKTPATISSSELARFGKLYNANARPVQPLDDREVKASR